MPNDEKILIIQMCRMGDWVQTLPLLKRLKEDNSRCEITVLAVAEAVELIRGTPFIDRILSIGDRDYSDMQRETAKGTTAAVRDLLAAPQLRELYGRAVNLTHDSVSAIICSTVSSSMKSGRISTVEGEIRTLGNWSKYLFAIAESRTENLFNLVDIQIAMGGAAHNPVNGYLRPDPADRETARGLLRAGGWEGESRPGGSRSGGSRHGRSRPNGFRHGRSRPNGSRLVGIQMGASRTYKTWPPESFAAAAGLLRRAAPGTEIVLLGSPDERPLSERFALHADFPFIDLVGKTEVKVLPAVLEECAVLISNDTGTAHIAAAVGTRVLGLYFSTYFGETGPYGKDHMLLQVELPCCPCMAKDRCEDHHCQAYITPGAVCDVALSMLGESTVSLPDSPYLSLYRSGFLSNGTLIYTPIAGAVSSHYRKGFITRVLWENGLGLKNDDRFIAELLPRLHGCEDFGPGLAGAIEEAERFGEQYRKALRYVHGIIQECSMQSLNSDKIQSFNTLLMGTQNRIASFGNSVLQRYHNFTMMDVDYVPYPRMAHQLAARYSHLLGVTGALASAARRPA